MGIDIGGFVSQGLKTMGAAATAVANEATQAVNGAVEAVGQAVGGVATGVSNRINEEISDLKTAEDAFNNKGVGAGLRALVDGFSPGDQITDTARAFGLLPSDNEALKDTLSGALNGAIGVMAGPGGIMALVAAGIDFQQVAEAKRSDGPSAVPPSERGSVTHPHCGERPTHIHIHRHHEHSPMKDWRIQLPTRHYCPGPMVPRNPGTVLNSIDASMKAILAELRKLVESGVVVGAPPSAPPLLGGAPEGSPTFPIAPGDREQVEHNGRNGEPVTGRPIGDVTFEDILNDPTLSFEDMLFMFMSKFGHQMKQEIQAQMKLVGEMTDNITASEKAADAEKDPAKKGDAGRKAGETAEKNKVAGKGAGASGGGNDFLKGFDDFLKGIAKDFVLPMGKELVKTLLPIAAAAIGTAIFPGVGTAIGGAVGGALAGPASDMYGQFGEAALDKMGGMGWAGGVIGGPGGMLVGALASNAIQSGPGAPGAPEAGAPADEKPALGQKFLDKSVDEKKNERDQIMEKIKQLQQKLSEMQTALSNMMNAQHQTAMNAIGNIR